MTSSEQKQKDQVNQKENSKDKVFTKLPKGSKFPPKEKILMSSTFSKQGNYMKSKRYFALYEDSIYYFNDQSDLQPKGYTNLDFELRFEIIREKVEKPTNEKEVKKEQKKTVLGKAKGIRFDRDGCQCELYGTDEKEIIKWRDLLRGKINQRGFHDLFRAQRKIGKGNFASVYLAERLEDEILFAVKAFSKEAAYNQEKGKEALITEIQLMRELDHPNIMKLHEVFETENSLYFILDLLEGGQLYDKIKAKTKFTQEQTQVIMKGLISAVAHMNERDIMHRDLKPENILFRTINDYSTVVIADLGLGTKVSLPEYLFVRCGTPGFVAPEVVNIKDLNTTYGAVCDMFSLGLIFHILLMGKSPFNGKTYNEVLQQNRNGTVKLDGPEYVRVTTDAFDLLKKMLQKEPEKRITSFDALKHTYFQPKQIKEKKKEAKQENGTTDAFDNSLDEIVEPPEDDVNGVSKNMGKLDHLVKSPPLQTPNLLPRQLGMQKLDGDSCVAFKMNNSPLITGNLNQIGEHKGGNIIDTPSINKRQLGTPDLMGRSPQQSIGKSPLSQYSAKSKQNGTNHHKDLQRIEETKEDNTIIQKDKETNQKKASKVQKNLQDMI